MSTTQNNTKVRNDTTIAQLGDPILKHVAQLVTFPLSDETRKLIKLLRKHVIEYKGVGLAAPQLHQRTRVIIVASRPNARYPSAPVMDPIVMINPEIKSMSSDTELGFEGCLSIPGIRGPVRRAKHIVVTYYDEAGQSHEDGYDNFIARIIQHEIDHLNGICFVERVENNRDLISEHEFFSLIDQRDT